MSVAQLLERSLAGGPVDLMTLSLSVLAGAAHPIAIERYPLPLV
jgi:hypothetical protein